MSKLYRYQHHYQLAILLHRYQITSNIEQRALVTLAHGTKKCQKIHMTRQHSSFNVGQQTTIGQHSTNGDGSSGVGSNGANNSERKVSSYKIQQMEMLRDVPIRRPLGDTYFNNIRQSMNQNTKQWTIQQTRNSTNKVNSDKQIDHVNIVNNELNGSNNNNINNNNNNNDNQSNKHNLNGSKKSNLWTSTLSKSINWFYNQSAIDIAANKVCLIKKPICNLIFNFN